MFKKQKCRKKVLVFALIILGVVVSFFLLPFVFLYSTSVQHFGYDSEMIDSLNEKQSMKNYIYVFYNEYLHYTDYYCYQTKLYYSIWEDKSLFSSAEGDSSYSFVVEAKDEYTSLLDKIKEETVFFDESFNDSCFISIDKWHFKEIYCNLTNFTNKYYESSFKMRNPSFWLGYNPFTKEISFSALLLKKSKDLSKEELTSYFITNFYM